MDAQLSQQGHILVLEGNMEAEDALDSNIYDIYAILYQSQKR